jgi:hypothetical protein
MSIAEKLTEVTSQDGPPWQVCSVKWVKDGLPKEEAEAVEKMLGLNVPFQKISEIIREETGKDVGPSALSRHKRNLCRCSK